MGGITSDEYEMGIAEIEAKAGDSASRSTASGVSQLSDFIDRAKLEAAMLQVDVAHFASKKPHPTVEDYATAVLALLDAEMTEEWGVRHISVDGLFSDLAHTSREAAEHDLGTCGWNCYLISRRVAITPWLPSGGCEKRG